MENAPYIKSLSPGNIVPERLETVRTVVFAQLMSANNAGNILVSVDGGIEQSIPKNRVLSFAGVDLSRFEFRSEIAGDSFLVAGHTRQDLSMPNEPYIKSITLDGVSWIKIEATRTILDCTIQTGPNAADVLMRIDGGQSHPVQKNRVIEFKAVDVSRIEVQGSLNDVVLIAGNSPE